jgi:type I restriction enzyme, S subunit
MRAAWEEKALGDICDVLDSKRIPITKRDRISGPYPYYGATGILDYVHEYIFNEKLILIGEDGAKWGAGEKTAFIAEGKFWVNNHAHVIRPDRSIVIDNWIVYWLNFCNLLGFTTGLTVPKLNQKNLRKIIIPLPPLPEQERIVEILNEAFTAIATSKSNAEKNLANAKELFESYLQGVFADPGDDWEEKALGEICDVRDGTHDSPKFHETGYPFITSKNLKNGKLNFNKIKYISQEDYNHFNKRSKVHKGDILFAMIGTLGNPVVVEIDPIFAIKNVGLIKVPDNQSNYFIRYFLSSDGAYKSYHKNARGVTQKFMGLGNLRKFKVPVPPIKDQNKIVVKLDAFFSKTNNLEALYSNKISDLDELKQSLLQKAFTGELTTDFT